MSFEIKNGGNGGGPTWEVGEGWEIRPFNLKLITRIAIGIAAVILIILALNFSKDVFTDWLWFDSLGFSSVYKKILLTRIWLFFGGALVAAGFLALNLYIAYRIARGESMLPAPPHVYTLARWGIIVGAVLFVLIASLVFGIVAQGRWETFLLFFNRVSFGVEDPQFSKDMSFHVATMPMFHFIQGWLMGLVITIAVAVMALYFAIAGIRGIKFNLTPKIRVHLAALGAALMLTIAAAHYLDIFELVFSGRGAAPGAGYTDVNARIPVLWLLVAISLVSAVGFVTSIYYGGLRLMVASFSLWAVLRSAMTKNYVLEIQDRIWQFIKESNKQSEPIDLEQSERVREHAEKFIQLIQVSDFTTEAQVTLLMQIYTMLLRFQLGQLIIQLENLQENGTD